MTKEEKKITKWKEHLDIKTLLEAKSYWQLSASGRERVFSKSLICIMSTVFHSIHAIIIGQLKFVPMEKK